jgi:hypothetical protein
MTDAIIRVTRPVPPFLLGFSTPALQVGDVAGLEAGAAAQLVQRGLALPVEAAA